MAIVENDSNSTSNITNYKIIQLDSKEFKETKVWTGLSDIAPDEQQLTFIYENPKNGNWTIAFYSLKNDKTCILMMGQASTFLNAKTKGSKS